eukprot:2841929-Amphidinium_carterae.1
MKPTNLSQLQEPVNQTSFHESTLPDSLHGPAPPMQPDSQSCDLVTRPGVTGEIKPGVSVRLRNLSSSAHLNGQCGTI